MIVLLNPHAGGGTALRKWSRLATRISATGETASLNVLSARLSTAALIRDAVAGGERHIVAAGGDGTVHDVLNAMMQIPSSQRSELIFGAVGLGSSNDFHKPLNQSSVIAGIPTRLNFRHTVSRDVGVVIVHKQGSVSTRYFLINASIGITAEGNSFFNRPDQLLRRLKVRHTGSAIAYAAVHAVMHHRDQPFSVDFPAGDRLRMDITNLGIVKNPHFSGSLRYDVPAVYDDGLFRVFAATGMSILERFQLLRALSSGRFPLSAKTRAWSLPGLSLESQTPFPLELDGEILIARKAEFTILRTALKVCS
ncbi:MAG: diacylglycerol kinase family protein [Bacteroidota bacterium]